MLECASHMLASAVSNSARFAGCLCACAVSGVCAEV
jgi:hypothetical protein